MAHTSWTLALILMATVAMAAVLDSPSADTSELESEAASEAESEADSSLDSEESAKKLAGVLKRMVNDLKMKKRFLDCKKEGEDCHGVPRCCGSLQCYWAKGYSMVKDGECVVCVEMYEKCQRDSQCCKGMICDKGNSLWTDGHCTVPRSSGKCYRDKQCAKSCSKHWYQVSGNCS